MTNQEKKTYLERYRKADQEIDRLCEELSRWRARATKITPTLETVGGHRDSRLVETAVEKILVIEEEINDRIDEALEIKQQVVDAIKTVPDQTLQMVLSQRYILGKTWEQVAAALHFSWRQIVRLHEKALVAIDEHVIECHREPVLS